MNDPDCAALRSLTLHHKHHWGSQTRRGGALKQHEQIQNKVSKFNLDMLTKNTQKPENQSAIYFISVVTDLDKHILEWGF